MINDQTILSSFDDKPTLLEWLKKVEDALKTDTATAVSVENPSANTYVFKIAFADGTTLSSGNVVFPDSVKDVSIKNGHIIVTQISGTQTDLGAINPYAGTIVENAETNTTEIGNNVGVNGDLSVQGSVVGRGIVTSIGRLTANNGIEVHGQGYVNGALGVTGNATIGGTITAGGKAIKAVEANPTGEATETLEKVKIGDVAYKVGAVIKDTISFVGQTDDFDIYTDTTGTKVRFTIPKTNELWGFFYKNVFVTENGELTGSDFSKIISSCLLVEVNNQRIRIPVSKQFGNTAVSHDSYVGTNVWYDSDANVIKNQAWYVHIPDNPETEQAWIRCSDATLTNYGSYITKITFIEFNYE